MSLFGANILASEQRFYCLRVTYLLTTKLLFLYMEAKMFCMEYFPLLLILFLWSFSMKRFCDIKSCFFKSVNRTCRWTGSIISSVSMEGCTGCALHKGRQAEGVSGAEIQHELCSLSYSPITSCLCSHKGSCPVMRTFLVMSFLIHRKVLCRPGSPNKIGTCAIRFYPEGWTQQADLFFC